MSEQLRRWLVGTVGVVVAVLVATGAVLPAEPFDAWTTTLPGADSDAAGAGEHALGPIENERKRLRLHVRTIARQRVPRVRPRLRMTPLLRRLRWREARLARAPNSSLDRSPPDPDRAPPSS